MINLYDSARALVVKGKGMLAADETVGHTDSYLKEHGIEGGEEMRRAYREMLFGTEGLSDYITGVIMFEGSLSEKTIEGVFFPELLLKKNIVPGVKVDQGLDPFPEGGDESITKGLIGLPERLQQFVSKHHTGFTKWRSVVKIDGTKLPTAQTLLENSKRLASYAMEVQKAGMVPLVEPEMLLKGTHSRLRAKEVLKDTLTMLVNSMEDQAVDMSGVIIKTSMVLSGKESGVKDTPEEVAEATMSVLLSTVPKDIPGIVFLSGGQSPDQATENLRAISKRAKTLAAPWPLTFCYARALQEEAITIWKGKPENVPAAREAFLARLKKVTEALEG